MDAGNAVTPLCFPNFQNEVLALADASAVDSSAVPTLLRFPLAGRETSGVSALSGFRWTQYFPLAVHSANFRSRGNVFAWLEDSLNTSSWAVHATKLTHRHPLTDQAHFSHCKPDLTQYQHAQNLNGWQLAESRWTKVELQGKHNSKTHINVLRNRRQQRDANIMRWRKLNHAACFSQTGDIILHSGSRCDAGLGRQKPWCWKQCLKLTGISVKNEPLATP